MPKCRYGNVFETAPEVDSVRSAIACIMASAMHNESGVIWVKVSNNRWAIGGNYDRSGNVWNGEAKIVPGNVADIEYLARTRN